MGKLTTHPEAQNELDEAIAYYEDKRTGLGREFRDEVLRVVARVIENPLRYSVRKHEVRRANLKRFPYHVNYLMHDDEIIVIAIAGDGQRPFYWLSRTK